MYCTLLIGLFSSEKIVTFTYSDLYDFGKVCSKLRQEIKGEIIDGTIRQEDFFKMQKRQIDELCNSDDYKTMQPVRYIGPQVDSKSFNCYLNFPNADF